MASCSAAAWPCWLARRSTLLAHINYHLLLPSLSAVHSCQERGYLSLEHQKGWNRRLSCQMGCSEQSESSPISARGPIAHRHGKRHESSFFATGVRPMLAERWLGSGRWPALIPPERP